MSGPTTTRDTHLSPRVGDTYRLGELWLRVEKVRVVDVLVRLLVPGVGDALAVVSIPLPRSLIHTLWTTQDLAWANAQVLTRPTGTRP